MDDLKEPQNADKTLVRPLVETKPLKLPKYLPVVAVVLIILAGLLTGFVLSKTQTSVPLIGSKPKVVKSAKMAGSTNIKAFPDKAEGVIEKGGIDGEGTHKIIRNPNDPSQTAYLTSSVVNLDDYVGKKVRVWGATFSAQKAGWLMDIGRVELLE